MRRILVSSALLLGLACGGSIAGGTNETHGTGTGGASLGKGGAGATAGSGASGGGAGIGATGGTGTAGTGGKPPLPACATQTPSPCGAALCGNGVRDTCTGMCNPVGGGEQQGQGQGGSTCGSLTESCDGTDLAGATCLDAGFFGGALACTSACAFDLSLCSVCGPVGGAVASCKTGIFGEVDPQRLALHALPDESIVVAWTETAAAGGGVRIAWLSPQGDLLSTTATFGPNDAKRVALTAADKGVLVAIDTSLPSVIVYQAAPDNPVPNPIQTFPGAFDPMLGSGPSGRMLAFQDGVTMLHAVSLSVSMAPTPLFKLVEPDFGMIVDAGGQFLIAQRGSNGVTIARLTPDGTVIGTSSPVGPETEYPIIALAGSEVRLTFADFGQTPSVKLAHLDAAAKLLSPPELLGMSPDEYNEVPILVDAGATLALFTGYTGQTGVGKRIDIRRFGPGASPDPISVARSPSTRQARMVRADGALVVAWIGGDCPARIGFARVTPLYRFDLVRLRVARERQEFGPTLRSVLRWWYTS